MTNNAKTEGREHKKDSLYWSKIQDGFACIGRIHDDQTAEHIGWTFRQVRKLPNGKLTAITEEVYKEGWLPF